MFKVLASKRTDSAFSRFIRTASAGEKKAVYKIVIREAAVDQAQAVELAKAAKKN